MQRGTEMQGEIKGERRVVLQSHTRNIVCAEYGTLMCAGTSRGGEDFAERERGMRMRKHAHRVDCDNLERHEQQEVENTDFQLGASERGSVAPGARVPKRILPVVCPCCL